MSKNPDLANFLLHKKSVSTKKFVKSVFYVIFTVVKSVDYCNMSILYSELALDILFVTFLHGKRNLHQGFFFFSGRSLIQGRSLYSNQSEGCSRDPRDREGKDRSRIHICLRIQGKLCFSCRMVILTL